MRKGFILQSILLIKQQKVFLIVILKRVHIFLQKIKMFWLLAEAIQAMTVLELVFDMAVNRLYN